MINAKSGNPDKSAELIDFIVKPETQKALKISASTVTGAEPDPRGTSAVLSVVADAGPGNQTFYTIQDQAFPKKVADQYFSIQSAVLQGKTSPAEAAKQMQDAVSAWAKS